MQYIGIAVFTPKSVKRNVIDMKRKCNIVADGPAEFSAALHMPPENRSERDGKYVPLRACPICKQRSVTVLGRLTYALFDDLEFPGAKTLVCCDGCGMMYDDVAFTEEQLQKYYRRNEHYAVYSDGGNGGLSADNMDRYDRIIDRLRPPLEGMILDVGCGQGGFAARCVRRGFSAAGIEPSQKSRDAGASAGIEVYPSIEKFAAGHPDAKIGAIVLSHIMEHLMNPLRMLKELARHAPDALVYMEVPDAASYLCPNSIRWHEMYFEHLNHFCKESLSNLAEQSRIEVLNAEAVSFSRNRADNICISLIGRFSENLNLQTRHPETVRGPRCILPPLPHCDLPPDDGPIALWGISQYAMLLMGSLPQLTKVVRMFDMSPAKIGRKIRGIAVEDPKEMATLAEETALVIPYSRYSMQMRAEIERSGIFMGRIIQI